MHCTCSMLLESFKGQVPDDTGVFELRSNQAGVGDLPALERASPEVPSDEA